MNFKLKSLKGFFWTRLKKKQSVSLLRLPLKGPLENELNGNEKWHHYYYCSSSIADVSILQITFLATLRGFSLNTSSFTAPEKKTYGSKVSLYGFIETTRQARKIQMVFTADFILVAIVPKKWKLEKEKSLLPLNPQL